MRIEAAACEDGKYYLPSDEVSPPQLVESMSDFRQRDRDRLNLQHTLMRIPDGDKLYFFPPHNPRRALDVGTD